MPKRNLSDFVLQHIEAPKFKDDMSTDLLADVLLKRLGIKRRQSKARHVEFFKKLLETDKPLTFMEVMELLGVSQAQTYEELRKWRSLGLVKFIYGDERGYALTAKGMDKFVDMVQKEINKFLEETKKIAKLFEEFREKENS